jgi:hypothetical protein
MIGVPAVWLQLASGTHAPRWRASLLDAAGAPLITDLPVTGGQLSREESGSPRTSAEVYLPASPQWQLLDQQYLPTGNRLRLEYTIDGDGLGNWVTLADLDITDSAISRPDDMWTLHAVDRSARIAVDDLARSTVPAIGGDLVVDAVRTLVQRTFPGTEVLATGPALTQTVPTKYNEDISEGSPWDLIAALCAEAQSEVFYDVARRVQIRPIPTVATTAVDAVDVGESGVITAYAVKHEMSINTVSLVYVNPTNDQVIRRGTAEDRRPYSPSAIQRVGSYVVEGRIISAEGAPSQAEADAAAAAILTANDKPRAAELQHPARPWLEPGDTVQVTFLGGPTENQVVESVGIDLGHEGLQTTRLRNHDYQMTQEVLP